MRDPLETLRALAVPGDLWGDVLGGGARVVFGVTPGRVVLRRPSGSVVVSLEPYDAPPMEVHRLSMLRADLCDKATRAHVAHLMAAGLRWRGCADCTALGETCPRCRTCEGWIRKPAPAWHLLPPGESATPLPPELAEHAPVLMACHVARVACGLEGIRTIAGKWEHVDEFRWRVGTQHGVVAVRPDGWQVRGADGVLIASGPETGPAGRAAADAAALTAGFALVTPDGLALPWPDLSAGGSDGR